MRNFRKTKILILLTIMFVSFRGMAETRLSEIVEIKPDSDDAFSYPFFLSIPLNEKSAQIKTMLVAPNNSGCVEDEAFHYERALKNIHVWAFKFFDLKVPILVPAFPRPRSEWKIYTHALNRNVLTSQQKKYARLDLQLIAMIEKAQNILKQKKILTNEKVALFGFSASAMFTNRFTVLHPDRVQAAAFGSPGGWAIAPHDRWNETELRYPVGTADLKTLTGKPFDKKSFQEVSLFYFLGDKDLNDSVIFRDSYEEQDEKLIREHFGNTPVARWQTSLDMYQSAGCNCQFKLYPGVHHEITSEVWKDILEFFTLKLRG